MQNNLIDINQVINVQIIFFNLFITAISSFKNKSF